MKILPLTVVAFCLGCASSLAAAADIAALVQTCETCHGPDGVSSQPDVPTIAGIDAATVSDAIYRFQDGVYPCPNSPMCAVVGDITHEDVEALGAYFAAKTFVPAEQSFDADKAARGAALHAAHCEQCHSGGGSNPADQASILAGQWSPYLRATLMDYAAGKGEELEAMQAELQTLSAEDIDALVNYYASVPSK
jgi:cytochrome subunit of sulfide dehydrogenase